MEPSELLARLTASLARLGVPYLVTGSMASTAYGEPRFTHDIDVVVDSSADRVHDFCAEFPAPEFYCWEPAVVDAVRRRFQFNIIHLESGFKVDVILATDSAFDRSRLARARSLAAVGTVVSFASPEDVIIKKLQYFQEGGSEKHLRDIAGVLKVQAARIDLGYIADWAARLGLQGEWQLVLSRLSPSPEDPS